MKYLFLIAFLSIFLLSFTSASHYPIAVIPLNGTGSIQPSTSFAFVFNFTTDLACSNVLLSYSETV